MLNFLPSPPRPSPGSRFQRSPPSPRSAGRGKTPHARRRGAASNRVRHSYSLVKQHMVLPAFADASAGKSVIRHSLGDGGSFPRRVFTPGFCFLGFAHPNEGWRSAEITLGCSGTRGRAITRHARRLARRLASLGRRSPLGAPPWRFWAPVP